MIKMLNEEKSSWKKQELRIIYYAHPLETYQSFLEVIMEGAVRKQFGEVYHIDELSKLNKIVNKEYREKLKDLFTQMSELVNIYGGKIPESDAKDVAYCFMEILKLGITVECNILFNPSIFSDIHLIIEAGSEEFKRKAFPFFCYGLIDHCDVIVAHGYVMDSFIRELLKSWLKLPEDFDKRIREYSYGILKLIESKDILWSPGTYSEIKYATEKGKKVFFLQNRSLKKATVDDLNTFITIPFDNYDLRLYNKLWQPIASSVYSILTQLNYDKIMETKQS